MSTPAFGETSAFGAVAPSAPATVVAADRHAATPLLARARVATDLDRLRLIGIWAPILFVAGLGLALEVLGRQLGGIRGPGLYVGILSAVAAGAYVFSTYMFRVIRAQEDEIRHRNGVLSTVNAVAVVANESLDLDEILQRTLDRVLELTGADAGEILLWDDEREVLVLRAFRGLAAEAFHETQQFKLGAGFPGAIAATGQAAVVDDLSIDDSWVRPRVKDAGFRSVAGVPLRAKRALVGVMDIAARQPGHFRLEDTDLLAALGQHIGVAVENARLHVRMRDVTVLEERQRIAREMHDGLAQQLGFLSLKLSAMEACAPTPECKTEFHQLRSVAVGAYEEVRQAVFGLKTLVSRGLGLVPTLAEYLHDYSEQTGVAVKLEVRDEAATRPGLHTEVQLIRIVQEALANVRKHARARAARVVFDMEGSQLVMSIVDDGRGFDRAEVAGKRGQSFGLGIMRERAESIGGTCDIESVPGRGTVVRVRVCADGAR